MANRVRALYLCSVIPLLLACGPSADIAGRRYLEEGRRSFAAGKYRDAEIAFRKALRTDSRSPDAQIGLAEAELRQDRTARAIVSLRRAAELAPDRVDVGAMLADALLREYSAERSRNVLEELRLVATNLRARAPGSFEASRVAAYLALAEGRRADALEAFRVANAAKPGQEDVVESLTALYVEVGRGDEAERLAREFLKANSQAAGVYDRLYVYYVGRKRVADAEALLKEKIERNPRVAAYRAQLAAHYAAYERNAEMQAVVDNLLKEASDLPGAYLEAGDLYGRLGRWADAVGLYERGAAANPGEGLVYRKRIADALLAQRDVPRAVAVLDGILRDKPDDVGIRAARASVLAARNAPGDAEAAIEEFRELSLADPSNPALHYHLGRAYLAKNDVEAGQRAFREAVNRNAGYLPALIALAETCLDNRRYQEAIERADELLRREPEHRLGRLLKASAQVGLGSYLQAEAALNALVRERPDFVEAQYQLGLLKLAQKKFAEAESILSKFQRPGQTDYRVLAGLAELHTAQGRTDEAVRLLRDELAANRADAGRLRLLLAATAARSGRTGLAIETYRRCLDDRPARPEDVRYALSELYFKNGDLKSAIAELELAKKSAPRDARVLVLLGSLLDAAGRASEAREHYRAALAADPGSPTAANNLAHNLAEHGGDLDEALALAQGARQKAPDQPEFADTIGSIYLKKNMHDAAAQVFKSLVEKHPDAPLYKRRLAQALLKKPAGTEQKP